MNRVEIIPYAKVEHEFDQVKFGRPRWIYFGPVSVYARMSPYYRGRTNSLQIANISVEAKYQREGLFKWLCAQLKYYASERDIHHLVIENVLNPHLSNHLRRKGWETLKASDDQEDAPTFCLKIAKKGNR